MSGSEAMMKVGVTGHQALTPSTERLVTHALERELARFRPLIGITSLAAGADQLFAEVVLKLEGHLLAIVPARGYEDTFSSQSARDSYFRLRSTAAEVIELPFPQPTEEAYWAAGREIVDRCELLIAVWDGEQAAGLGGTGDVVRYARESRKRVLRLWPRGSRRAASMRPGSK
jgi:hypothetical protein